MSKDYSKMYRKPANCHCSGSLASKKHKWVVLQRAQNDVQLSELKCLICNWRWWSKKGYVAKLKDWKERSRKGMTLDHILYRLHVAEDLRIDPVTSIVEACRPSALSKMVPWKELQQYGDSHDSGYLFVSVSFQGMKRKVGVHVLQWMQAHGSVAAPNGAPLIDLDHTELFYDTGIPLGNDVNHLPPQPKRPEAKNNALEFLSVRDWLENQRAGSPAVEAAQLAQRKLFN